MKNVVFDLGGVVMDWNPQRVLEEYPGDKELPISLFERGFFEKYWQDFDRGVITEENMVGEMAVFADRSVAECREFIEYIKHSLVDIPRTVGLIEKLSGLGYKLFCLSNMSYEFYDYLKDRKVFEYFDGRIISAYEKVIKPDAAIYKILTERFGLIPEETLFIDDLEKNIEAARKLGFKTVHFADKEKGYKEIDRILKL